MGNMHNFKEGTKTTGESTQSTPTAKAWTGAASKLFEPTMSTKIKMRGKPGELDARMRPERSRLSQRSNISSVKSTKEDGSSKSADTTKTKEIKNEKPRIKYGREPENPTEVKNQQGSARFLSPIKRERVFNNSSNYQIERATGIRIRPSRLKQKLQDKRRSAFNHFFLNDVDQKLVKIICQFLHEPRSGLPGQTIQKFALMSKMHYSVLTKIYNKKQLKSN